MAEEQSSELDHQPHGFLRRYFFSTDHKVIGIQYLLTSMAMALVAGGLAMMIRLQLAWPGRTWPLLEKLFRQLSDST